MNCRNPNIPGYCCQRSVFCYCYRNVQARNQPGTQRGAKSFLRGAHIFVPCPIVWTMSNTFFQGEQNFSRGCFAPLRSPGYGPGNVGHFVWSVETIKRFVNVHLHCIVSNVPCKVRKYSEPQKLLRSEISFSSIWNIPKQWKLPRKQEIFEWNVYFVGILIRLCIHYIIII